MMWHVTYTIFVTPPMPKKIRDLHFFCYATHTHPKKVHATYASKKCAIYAFEKIHNLCFFCYATYHQKKKCTRPTPKSNNERRQHFLG